MYKVPTLVVVVSSTWLPTTTVYSAWLNKLESKLVPQSFLHSTARSLWIMYQQFVLDYVLQSFADFMVSWTGSANYYIVSCHHRETKEEPFYQSLINEPQNNAT